MTSLPLKRDVFHHRYKCPKCRGDATERFMEESLTMLDVVLSKGVKAMSYTQALRMAGASVLEFKQFGSYQGTWLALVFYKDEFRWVRGDFGSCSHCDAFEAEFSWNDNDGPELQQRLADFGKVYLDDEFTEDELLKEYKKDSDWDAEANEIIEFIESHSTKPSNKVNLIKKYLMENTVLEDD